MKQLYLVKVREVYKDNWDTIDELIPTDKRGLRPSDICKDLSRKTFVRSNSQLIYAENEDEAFMQIFNVACNCGIGNFCHSFPFKKQDVEVIINRKKRSFDIMQVSYDRKRWAKISKVSFKLEITLCMNQERILISDNKSKINF